MEEKEVEEDEEVKEEKEEEGGISKRTQKMIKWRDLF